MKNVLIFWGSGFIGTYLVKKKKKKRYNVTVADIKPSNYFKKEIYKKCDILNPHDIKNVFSLKKFDYVYNLAGFADLDESISKPIETIKLNVIWNLNILEACKNHNIKRFIYAGSAYAFSNKWSFYGISKLTSEKLIEEYYNRFWLKFSIIRYWSVYWERDFWNNYIMNLIKWCYKTKTIEHNWDGEELREYIHATDVAKLSITIMENQEYENEHIIITWTEKMKRIDLFKMIQEIMWEDIKISFKNNWYKHHYKYTPYSFSPNPSKKLIANPYIDMWQGVLECVKAIYLNNNDE